MIGWRRMLASELARSLTAAGLAVPLGALSLFLSRRGGGAEPFVNDILIGLACYQVLYVMLTALLLRTEWAALGAWAEASHEPTWLHRYVLLREPGAGLTLYVALVALAAVVALVSGQAGGVTDRGILAAGVVVPAAWCTMWLSFALDYLLADARQGWSALSIPGRETPGERSVTDYLYLAGAVSTSFTVPDITVQSAQMRGAVLIHGIAAFVFNTVVLAVTVSVLMGG